MSTGTIARGILLPVALAALLCAVTLVFLAGRPPQTFAASWSTPATLPGNAGTVNFGAVAEAAGRWDLLWVDTRNQLQFRAAPGRTSVLDHGDVEQPTLARVGGVLLGAWIHNYNGGTELRAMIAAGAAALRVFTLLNSRAPIEHPYAFAGPNGLPSLVFSWQKYGNFDVFLLSLSRDGARRVAERRLTVSQYYSFNPQAVTDARGDIDLLHLESCCGQQQFNVDWDRYNPAGRRVAPTRVLAQVTEKGLNTLQRGEALGRDGAGDIWGAFTVDSGVDLVHANADGILQGPPESLDPFPEQPNSIALALGPRGGYGIWEQTGIATDLASRHFDSAGMSEIQRIEYVPGEQQNVHAAFLDGRYRVIWQRLTPDGRYEFDTTQHRKAVGPDLAERLGLGLGNPWAAAAVLFGGAAGLGALGAAINVIDAILLTALGLLVLRLLRSVPARWLVIAALLTAAFYAIFVAPGLPVIFLSTLPTLGFAGAQFVAAAMGGTLVFVGVLGQTALRRLDDLYRLAGMAFLGLFFIAFIEAALFIQQELGYI